ncbi:MAG: polysaccharide pyruvyl transferase family protein [Planctomycetota bacterium]|jgi:exopolysaccharide biosynthesis predicted pyruvyltransferase EpsI
MRVRSFLETFRGGSVHVPPIVMRSGRLAGNHGDRLIDLGTRKVLEDLELREVDDPEAADLLIQGGGGHMLERYHSGPTLFRRLACDHPRTPLVLLPGSFLFPTRDLSELMPADRAPVTLFCRERISLEHLHGHRLPDYCSVELDHDMAFELADGELVAQVASGSRRHVLIVERHDVEHHGMGLDARGVSLPRRTVSRLMPKVLKRPLYPLVRRARASRRTPFRSYVERLVAERFPDAAPLPRLVGDVSLPSYGTFDDFVAVIRDAALVATTRLHVGILSALGGKPTMLFEGAYHKVRGIYELSLADRPNVTLESLPAPNDGAS